MSPCPLAVRESIIFRAEVALLQSSQKCQKAPKRKQANLMNSNEYFVTGMALSQFYHGANALKLDAASILAQAGLSQEHLVTTAHVPERQYEQFIEALIAAHSDSCLGIDVGRQIMLPLYGPLISLTFHSPTLADSIESFARFFSLATGNCGGMEHHTTAGKLELTAALTHRSSLVRQHVVECVLVLLAGFLRLVASQPQLAFDGVWIEHAPRNDSSRRRLESILGCPVIWGKRLNKVVISESTRQLRVLGHDSELFNAAQEQAKRQLEKVSAQDTWLNKVKWHVRDLMQVSSPRRESVAARLHISTKTLDRRLVDEGFSWQSLLDEVRLQEALAYLAITELSIADIAAKLGFSDVRAFQRRFKKWTAKTPSAYRAELTRKTS